MEGRLELRFCDRGQSGFRVTQDGTQQTFGPGDSFVIPRNTGYTWVNEVTIEKTYMIVDTDGLFDEETKDILRVQS